MKDHLQGDRKFQSFLNIRGNSRVDYYCSAEKLMLRDHFVTFYEIPTFRQISVLAGIIVINSSCSSDRHFNITL